MQIVFVPKFDDRPGNPGRCIIPAERIEINHSVWQFLPDEQKEFVFYHELGHCKEKTYDECAADNYALREMALKKPNSLFNHYKAVKAISHNDTKRVDNAIYQTLKISASEGSKDAAMLLKEYFPYANAEGPKVEQKPLLWPYLVIIIIILIITLWILKK